MGAHVTAHRMASVSGVHVAASPIGMGTIAASRSVMMTVIGAELALLVFAAASPVGRTAGSAPTQTTLAPTIAQGMGTATLVVVCVMKAGTVTCATFRSAAQIVVLVTAFVMARFAFARQGTRGVIALTRPARMVAQVAELVSEAFVTAIPPGAAQIVRSDPAGETALGTEVASLASAIALSITRGTAAKSSPTLSDAPTIVPATEFAFAACASAIGDSKDPNVGPTFARTNAVATGSV